MTDHYLGEIILFMFIRSSKQKSPKTQKSYTTFRLVDGYRTPDGKVRQRLLLNLGASFSVPQEDWKSLADRVEEVLSGQISLFTLTFKLEKEAHRIAKIVRHKHAEILSAQANCKIAEYDAKVNLTDFHDVDINSLTHEDVRHVGPEQLAVHAAQHLDLNQILTNCGLNSKQCVLAMASILGRLISPGSELRTHRYLTQQSALDELLQTDFSNLSLKNFYSIADLLLKHKDSIEAALFEKEKNVFDLEQVVTLYDITNTYFEGRSLQNCKAQLGRSKEKRSDCPLVSMGLVLDASGFPQRSEIFAGNVSEPQTLPGMLNKLNAKKGATVVMDAGFASEKNVKLLQESGYFYIVVSRKAKPIISDDIASVVVKDSITNKVTATLMDGANDKEVILYCHSQAKEEKTKAIQVKAENRFEDELQKLKNGLQKKTGTKKLDKITDRVGRLKERHKRVAKRFKIEIHADDVRATDITWQKEVDEHLGIYCLRSNRLDLKEKSLWELYTTLTNVEAAFRSLKTELGFRPVFHQKETRVDAHLFISIIAYHLLHTIRYQLKHRGITLSWEHIRQIFDTQVRLTSSMKLKNGKSVSIRKSSKATPEQLVIYKALNIQSEPGKIEKVIF